MIKKDKDTERIIRLYKKSKGTFKLPPQYLEAFEYRYGLFDDEFYTYKEISERLGISNTRVEQLLGRVMYKLEARK